MRCRAKETVYVNGQIFEDGEEFVLKERRGHAQKDGKLVPIVIGVEQQFDPNTMERLDAPPKAAKAAPPKAQPPKAAKASGEAQA